MSIYRNAKGQEIAVEIVQDCGLVNGRVGKWHKVLAKPVGLNPILMTLDKTALFDRTIQESSDRTIDIDMPYDEREWY